MKPANALVAALMLLSGASAAHAGEPWLAAGDVQLRHDLQLLVDEGLIVGAETDGKKKLFELTEDGRQAAEKVVTPPWDEIADGVPPAEQDLRTAAGKLFGALAQSTHAADADQQQRIVEIVNNARREIYQILGDAE